MGRQSKLTPQLQKKITGLLAKGVPDNQACEAVNISTVAFYGWLQIGQCIIDDKPHERMPDNNEDRERFVNFVNAVARARTKANNVAVAAFRSGLLPATTTETITEEVVETRLKRDGTEYKYEGTTTRTVERVAPPDWRAGAEWLLRRDPANWARREGVELTGKDGGAIQVNMADILKQVQEWEDERRKQADTPQ